MHKIAINLQDGQKWQSNVPWKFNPRVIKQQNLSVDIVVPNKSLHHLHQQILSMSIIKINLEFISVFLSSSPSTQFKFTPAYFHCCGLLIIVSPFPPWLSLFPLPFLFLQEKQINLSKVLQGWKPKSFAWLQGAPPSVPCSFFPTYL